MKKLVILFLLSTLLFSCTMLVKQTKPTQVNEEATESTLRSDKKAQQSAKEAPTAEERKETKPAQANNDAPKSNVRPNERAWHPAAKADSSADEGKQIKPVEENDDAPKPNTQPDEQAQQSAKDSANTLTPYPPDYERNFKADFERGYAELKAVVQSYEELSRSDSLTADDLSSWKKSYDHIISTIFGANIFFAAGGSPESAKHYAIWPRYLKNRIEALKQLKIINKKFDGVFPEDVKKELQAHYEIFEKQLSDCEQVLPPALEREAEITGQRPPKRSRR